MPPMRLQLEGPSLEELLGRVQREHGDGARILQAEKVRSGGIVGFFARERFQIELEVDAAPVPPAPRRPRSLLDLADSVNEEEERLVALPRARTAPVSTESPSFAAVLAGLTADIEEPELALARPGRKPRARAAVPPVPAAPAAPTAPNAPEAKAPARKPARKPALPARQTQPTSKLPARQAPKTALPARRGRAAAQPDPVPAWLRSLPSVAPAAYVPGQVIAVVGDLVLAQRAARALSLQLGVDEPDLYVASANPAALRGIRAARRLTDPAAVGRQRARWARRTDSTLVVVDAPLLLRPEGWARAVLAGLAADVVWGAVSATTKVEDVVRWTERVGGVDALSVHEVEATANPAAILDAAIPVGLVDGVRSTPAVWAALLADRAAA